MSHVVVTPVEANDPRIALAVERLPDAALYDTAPWRHFLEEVTGTTWRGLLALRAGDPVGYIGWHERAGPLGRVINSHPWYGTPGGCRVHTDDDAARRALLDAFVQSTDGPDRLVTVLVLTPDETCHLDRYREALGPVVLDGRIAQSSPLPAATAEPLSWILEKASTKTRNLIRKSLRQDFTVEVDERPEAWAFLIDTHRRNMASIGGRAKPVAHFEAWRRCLPPASRGLWVARSEGGPVAALFTATAHGVVEYLTPVIEVEARPRQPLSRLIVAAMIQSMQAGAHTWNWGGTWLTQRGVYHFKRGWGAIDRPYAYVISAAPDARTRLRARPDAIGEHYAWFYVYPLSQLTEPA